MDEDYDSTAHTAPVTADSIVVGHDGSRGADLALAEALVLGRALQAPVVVVRAWSLITAPKPAGWERGYAPSLEEYAVAVRDALLEDTRARREAFPEVEVSHRVVHDGASACLVEMSHEARLLVVGARGLGGLAGMLLGSVSEQCLRHATCSVLVAKPRP